MNVSSIYLCINVAISTPSLKNVYISSVNTKKTQTKRT